MYCYDLRANHLYLRKDVFSPQIPSPNDTLVVRPIMASEREAWDTLMDRHHYLGFRVIVGESLRYVAFLGKRPVALIGGGAAAFKRRHRDAWIGWGGHPQKRVGSSPPQTDA